MPSPVRIPELLALITCENIHRHELSGQHSIIATYNHICAPSFPWTEEVVMIYLAFTDGNGKVPMSIRIIDNEQILPPLFESEMTMSFPNPVKVVEMACYGTNIVFPKPGEYRLQVFASGLMIGEKRLIVWRGSRNGKLKH